MIARSAGHIENGGDETDMAVKKAQAQADASAFLAANEAAIADAYDVPRVSNFNP